MVFKKAAAILISISVLGSVFTACSSNDNKNTESSSDSEFEETVKAESGDAYLAFADGEWYIQYWGNNTDMLTYDAGVAEITGNGDYTVSLNGATKGMLYDVAGTLNGKYTPSGCSFMAVIVKDGSKLYPDMSIDIKSIRINGEEIEQIAKNYTSSDDGIEMRANIYNEWIEELPEDAHTSEGLVNGNSEYSARIIDRDKIGQWTKIEVEFTVSGIDE